MRKTFNETPTVTLLYGESRFDRLLNRLTRGTQKVSTGVASVRNLARSLRDPGPAATEPDPVQKMPAVDMSQFALPALMVGGVLLLRFLKRKDRSRKKGRR